MGDDFSSPVWGLLPDTNQFTPQEDKLSDLPPKNEQTWAHLVIFEPQPKIRLTCSSYQVTTFLDFVPYMNRFLKVKKYIENYCLDLHNPSYFKWIKHVLTSQGSSPLMDDDAAFQSSEYCKHLPYICSAQLKIDRYLLEIEYLYNLFSRIYCKFLNAIDHIEFHPSNLSTNDMASCKKRSTILDIGGHYYPSPSELTPSEEELLDRLLQAILEINPGLYNHMRRVKCFGLMT